MTQEQQSPASSALLGELIKIIRQEKVPGGNAMTFAAGRRSLCTRPGIPQHMHPVVALVTAGVEMDVLGLTYGEYSHAEREAVVHAHPRSELFKEDIIQAFYDGIKHKPDTTFGNVKADVLADKDPAFRRGNFCSVIRGSAWRG